MPRERSWAKVLVTSQPISAKRASSNAAWNAQASQGRRGLIAGRAPGRPKPTRVPSGDRPMYASDEGLPSHGGGVQQAALAPQVVRAARQLPPRVRAHVATD